MSDGAKSEVRDCANLFRVFLASRHELGFVNRSYDQLR
jgi:hypothetical protein